MGRGGWWLPFIVVLAVLFVAPAMAPVRAQDDAAPSDAADASAPAPVDGVQERKAALADELAKARQAVAAASAEGREPPAPLTRAVTLLQQIDLVLDQQIAELLRAAELDTANAEREASIVALQTGGLDEPGPYTFTVFDRLRDELAVEEARDTLVSEAVAAARAGVDGAHRAKDARDRAHRQAREALETKGGDDDVTALAAARRLAELEARLAAEQLTLRTRELENAERELTRHELARSYLEHKVALVAKQARFTRADLQDRLAEVETEADRLTQALAAANEELGTYMTWWADARRALDREAPGSDRFGEYTEQVEAMRLARAARQEQIALLTKQLERVARRKEAWQRRFAVALGVERPELIAWKREAEDAVAQLDRTGRLQQGRLDELRATLGTLDEKIETLPASMTRHWVMDQRDRTRALMESYESEIASIGRHRRIEQRLLSQIDDLIGTASVGDRAADAWKWVGTVWNFELTQFEERPITVSKVVLGVGLFILGIWVSSMLSRLVGRLLLPRFGVNEDARVALRTLLFYTLLLLFTLLAMHLINVPLTVFTLLGGALAIGIGFGAKNLINNFISGWILISERPVRIGDLVEIDGIVGNIERVGGRSTRIRRTDGIHLLVPNSLMLEQTLVNWTHADEQIRTRLRIGVVYGSPTDQVEALIRRIVVQNERVLPFPEPIIIFEDFGDNALIFDVYFWVNIEAEMDLRRAASEIRFAIDHAFRAAGISIAFPQRDVHLDASSPIPVRMVEAPAAAGHAGAEDTGDVAARADAESMSRRKAILGRVELFDTLDADEISSLATALAERHFEPKADIVAQGGTGSSLYIVTDGLLDVSVQSNGRKRQVGQLMPGDFFGEMSMLTGDPHTATVSAVTAVRAYEVSSEMLEPILKARPEICTMLGRVMATRRAKTARSSGLIDEGQRPGTSDLRRRIHAFFGLD